MSAIPRRRNGPDAGAQNVSVDRLQYFPIDSQIAEIVRQCYSAPEVNLLQDRAYRATDIIEDTTLNAASKRLPMAAAFGLIITISLCCWGAIAAGIWMSFDL